MCFCFCVKENFVISAKSKYSFFYLGESTLPQQIFPRHSFLFRTETAGVFMNIKNIINISLFRCVAFNWELCMFSRNELALWRQSQITRILEHLQNSNHEKLITKTMKYMIAATIRQQGRKYDWFLGYISDVLTSGQKWRFKIDA